MTMPLASSAQTQALATGASSQTATGQPQLAEPFRFAQGPGVPPWAVGKTNQEVLAMSVQMAEALQTVQPTRNPTQQQPVQQPVAAVQPTMPTQDDYTLDPIAATQRTLEYNYGLRVQPVLDQLAAQMAGTGRQVAQMQHPEEFKRWAPEIDQLIVNVPSQQRTAELYSQAVRLVKANHLDELVAERAREQMGASVGDRTSAGGAIASGTVATVDLTKLSPAYKAAMDAMGIGPGELHEFLGKTGQTMEQFVESANRNQVITDVSYDKKGRSQVVMDMEKMYPKGTKVTAW